MSCRWFEKCLSNIIKTSSVNCKVPFQMGFQSEFLFTIFTFESLFSGVKFEMGFQVAFRIEFLFAIVTFVWILTWFIKLDLQVKPTSHISHLNFFFSCVLELSFFSEIKDVWFPSIILMGSISSTNWLLFSKVSVYLVVSVPLKNTNHATYRKSVTCSTIEFLYNKTV